MKIRRDTFNLNLHVNKKITLECCDFDRLLDVSVHKSTHDFKLDVSYLTSDQPKKDKKIILLLMVENESFSFDEFGVEPSFLKLVPISISDVNHSIYIFYYEIKSTSENRDYKIDNII